MKKILLFVCTLIALHTHAQNLRAMPDSFTVLQAGVDTFNVTNNDSIPPGDSVCISLIGAPAYFTLLNCHSIVYHPDSSFTGRDTCYYALCDTSGICDTAMVVVSVDTNYGLLPVAGFKEDTSTSIIYYGLHELFNSTNCFAPECVSYQLVNTSTNFDSIIWEVIFSLDYCLDTIQYYRSDTINLDPDTSNTCGSIRLGSPIIVCITAYNQFGSTTLCDTSCPIDECEGIAEVPLSNIKLYPSPADRILTIDMSQNNNAISSNYTAIYLYDALGQRVSSLPRKGSNKMVEVPVSNLPDGIYLATITDAKGTEMMLGKFTVMK